ncbi:MAG: S-adenosylmethionine:tRNA ribosyltransferase-isomerase, partial [Pyrinomonadaceae bacterium]
MWLDEFDFDLPEELIAQHPPPRREESRMLVLSRSEKTWQDQNFYELPDFIEENDLIIVNNTRVFPARLNGEKVPSGGRIELLLIKEVEKNVWLSLARPARRLHSSDRLLFSNGATKLMAEVIDARHDGMRTVRFFCDGDFDLFLDKLGRTPLPPYIKRDDATSSNMEAIDRKRYQTVFAKKRGSIAAPTAGLHFT